ncbi:hypothetical protein D3C72_2036930 [compost metagenome]
MAGCGLACGLEVTRLDDCLLTLDAADGLAQRAAKERMIVCNDEGRCRHVEAPSQEQSLEHRVSGSLSI